VGLVLGGVQGSGFGTCLSLTRQDTRLRRRSSNSVRGALGTAWALCSATSASIILKSQCPSTFYFIKITM